VNYGSAAQPWEGQCGYELVEIWLYFLENARVGYDFFTDFWKGLS
jgi:hypothetical protein